VKKGLTSIKQFFINFGQESAYSHSNEVKVLKRFAREIRRMLPVDPSVKLQQRLEKAVKLEKYEEAAKLRDELKQLEGKSTAFSPPSQA
jgi:protein-arginine kinase activator protein McsA